MPSFRGPARTAATPAVDAKRLRVLVVDDYEDAAECAAAVIGLLGHEVEYAKDGPSALRTAERLSPDVVLLDLGMPTMDGFELARRLRTSLTTPPTLIAVTGWGRETDREKTAEAGFACHLLKPVEPAVLQEVFSALSVRAAATGAEPPARPPRID